jgi:hypothetical protein
MEASICGHLRIASALISAIFPSSHSDGLGHTIASAVMGSSAGIPLFFEDFVGGGFQRYKTLRLAHEHLLL